MEPIVKYLWLIPALPLVAAGSARCCRDGQRRLSAALAIGGDQHFLPVLVRRLLDHAAWRDGRTCNFRWFDFGSTSVQLGWVLDPLTAIMLGDGDAS